MLHLNYPDLATPVGSSCLTAGVDIELIEDIHKLFRTRRKDERRTLFRGVFSIGLFLVFEFDFASSF